MKLKLTGAKRYNIGGELFLSHEADGRTEVIYIVDEEKGEYLMEQVDPQSGYGYFDEYTGDLEGRKPGSVDDEKPERRERPKVNERRRREPAPGEIGSGTRVAGKGMGPRNHDLSATRTPRAGRPTAPIEDADATTV